MVITEDHIGGVIYMHNTGEHLLVNKISGKLAFLQCEDGSYVCSAVDNIKAIPELNKERIEAFNQKVAYANTLNAAAEAAIRRLTDVDIERKSHEEALTVFDTVNMLRKAFRETSRPSHTQNSHTSNFNNLIVSAQAKASAQFNEQNNPKKTIDFSQYR